MCLVKNDTANILRHKRELANVIYDKHFISASINKQITVLFQNYQNLDFPVLGCCHVDPTKITRHMLLSLKILSSFIYKEIIFLLGTSFALSHTFSHNCMDHCIVTVTIILSHIKIKDIFNFMNKRKECIQHL